MSNRFDRAREAITLAEDFVELVEELCVEDLSDPDEDDAETLTEDDLEDTQEIAGGDYLVKRRSQLDIDPVAFLSAKKKLRGDNGRHTLYTLHFGHLISCGVELEFLLMPDTIDVIPHFGISDDTAPVRYLVESPSERFSLYTLRTFRRVIDITRRLREKGGLQQIEIDSYYTGHREL